MQCWCGQLPTAPVDVPALGKCAVSLPPNLGEIADCCVRGIGDKVKAVSRTGKRRDIDFNCARVLDEISCELIIGKWRGLEAIDPARHTVPSHSEVV